LLSPNPVVQLPDFSGFALVQTKHVRIKQPRAARKPALGRQIPCDHHDRTAGGSLLRHRANARDHVCRNAVTVEVIQYDQDGTIPRQGAELVNA
jgi:hypothetical protein